MVGDGMEGDVRSEPESGRQLAWARACAAAAALDDSRADALRAILLGESPGPIGLALDPDLRWSMWIALAATGFAEPSDLDHELRSDGTSAGRIAHARALASLPTAATKQRVWQAATTDFTLSNDHLDAMIGGFKAGVDASLIEGYAADYLPRCARGGQGAASRLRGAW